jgi:hypothetical protein
VQLYKVHCGAVTQCGECGVVLHRAHVFVEAQIHKRPQACTHCLHHVFALIARARAHTHTHTLECNPHATGLAPNAGTVEGSSTRSRGIVACGPSLAAPARPSSTATWCVWQLAFALCFIDTEMWRYSTCSSDLLLAITFDSMHHVSRMCCVHSHCHPPDAHSCRARRAPARRGGGKKKVACLPR